MRQTKIVATLGPATDSEEAIKELIRAGVDVCRLNFSHGSADDQKQRAWFIRKAAKELNKAVAIIADLQGPKIRISKFASDFVDLAIGDIFFLDGDLDRHNGNDSEVGLDFKNLGDDCAVGDTLVLDDGRIVLEIKEIVKRRIKTTVIKGGRLSNNKGINKQGGGLSAPALTPKDFSDLAVAVEIDAEYLAVSFPRSASDMTSARLALKKLGGNSKLMAKIERAEVVESSVTIDAMILASDAVMVARGDLGVEIGDERLVGIQKQIISRARALDRIVVTATQMMESMIASAVPTRAEVFDVANAVLDGTDAVMLSGETAVGAYPIETVEAMARTAVGAEQTPEAQRLGPRGEIAYQRRDEAIALGAMYIANNFKKLSAIICVTESGSSPLWMSRSGGSIPIVAVSSVPKTLSFMALFRGVFPMAFPETDETDMETIDLIIVRKVVGQFKLEEGSFVMLTRGDRHHLIGGTSTVRIFAVSDLVALGNVS